MKTLTLLRHAKSAWDDAVARDFDRPLNIRGRKAAKTIGREMRAQGLRFDRVIASPAVRVASVETLLELIRGANEAAERLLIVGHNPGLEMLAMRLTTGEGLRNELAVKYPTATIAEISLPVDRWSEVAEGIGTLARFIRPRDLDPELGPDEDSF
jgi:phosphohistidine phosphatase